MRAHKVLCVGLFLASFSASGVLLGGESRMPGIWYINYVDENVGCTPYRCIGVFVSETDSRSPEVGYLVVFRPASARLLLDHFRVPQYRSLIGQQFTLADRIDPAAARLVEAAYQESKLKRCVDSPNLRC